MCAALRYSSLRLVLLADDCVQLGHPALFLIMVRQAVGGQVEGAALGYRGGGVGARFGDDCNVVFSIRWGDRRDDGRRWRACIGPAYAPHRGVASGGAPLRIAQNVISLSAAVSSAAVHLNAIPSLCPSVTALARAIHQRAQPPSINHATDTEHLPM